MKLPPTGGLVVEVERDKAQKLPVSKLKCPDFVTQPKLVHLTCSLQGAGL